MLAWLWSVNSDEMDGLGWALTLTMGGTPATADEWNGARRAFLRRLERKGITQHLWVTEWTAKGRPHLHLAVYGPGRVDAIALVAWLLVCDRLGWDAAVGGQHIVPIDGARGWLEYVSKHAARGVDHYQRQGAPEGWERTGRLWGKGGPWPIEQPVEVELQDDEFHRYRRLAREWQRQRMRRAGAPARSWKRIGWRYGDRERGRLMGVSGWMPDTVSLDLVELAVAGPQLVGMNRTIGYPLTRRSPATFPSAR